MLRAKNPRPQRQLAATPPQSPQGAPRSANEDEKEGSAQGIPHAEYQVAFEVDDPARTPGSFARRMRMARRPNIVSWLSDGHIAMASPSIRERLRRDADNAHAGSYGPAAPDDRENSEAAHNGTFSRSLALPASADEAHIEASYGHGILEGHRHRKVWR